MNAFAFVIFGILGAALLILVFNGNDGTIGPMTDDQFAGTVYLGLLGTVIAAALFASGQRFGAMARQAGRRACRRAPWCRSLPWRPERQRPPLRINDPRKTN